MALKLIATSVFLAAGMCSGSVQGEMTQTTPGGTTTYKLGGEWQKTPSTGSVTVTLNAPPAGSPATPGGSYAMQMKDKDGNVVKTIEVVMPTLQPGSGQVTVTAVATDPWVVQLPEDWNLTSLIYETPAGSVAATITQGDIPWNLDLTPNGPVASQFYVAEPGYKTYLVEVPEDLLVEGRHSAIAYVDCAPGARRMDTVKVIETGIMSVAGHATRAFFPLNGNVHDFALYSDLFLTFDVELGDPKCSGPIGHKPHFLLDHCHGWQVDSVGELRAAGLDPAAPAMYMVGGFTYLSPGISVQGYGCLLNVSLDSATPLSVSAQGESSISMTIPNDNSLIGYTLFWQAAQLYQDGSVLTGDVFKTIVESGQ